MSDLKNTPNMSVELYRQHDTVAVFIGEPGLEEWAAAFRHYTDAYNWACEVAILHECRLRDFTANPAGESRVITQ